MVVLVSVLFVAGSLLAFAGQMWARVLTRSPLTDRKQLKSLYGFLFLHMNLLGRCAHGGDHPQNLCFCLSLKCLHYALDVWFFKPFTSFSCLQPKKRFDWKEDEWGSKRPCFALDIWKKFLAPFLGEKSEDDSEQWREPTAEPEWASSHQKKDPVEVAAGQEESTKHLKAGCERILHQKCLCAPDHFCCYHW